MLITYGSENDLTDYAFSDRALHINSCGMNTTLSGQRSLSDELLVSRPAGRRDYQLLYMTMGLSEHAFDGEWRTVRAGQAVLYQPGEEQRYRYPAHTPVCCKWVHFSGSTAHELLESSGLLASAPLMSIGESSEISDLFDRMIQESQLKPPVYALMLPALLAQIIALMGRQMTMIQNESSYKTLEKLMRAAESMYRHCGENRSVEQYAAECGMSKYHFTHTFSRMMGCPPRDYLSRIRLERARELLTSTHLPIGQIGVLCGYENPLHFSRFFSEHCGMAPTRYRKIHTLLPE